MPTPTYIPLQTITLGSAASSVTFASIPQTYRDLVLVAVALGSTTLQGRVRLNSDSGSNYSSVRMSGNGSSSTSASLASQTSGSISTIATATTGGALQVELQIQDYSATDKHKTMLSRADQSATGAEAFAVRWASTSAVTSVQILTSTGNWAVGGTFSLYAIEA